MGNHTFNGRFGREYFGWIVLGQCASQNRRISNCEAGTNGLAPTIHRHLLVFSTSWESSKGLKIDPKHQRMPLEKSWR